MKIKTHSGAKKRYKKNGAGKLFTEKAAKRHLLSNKSKKQKKAAPHGKAINPSNLKRAKKLLVM